MFGITRLHVLLTTAVLVLTCVPASANDAARASTRDYSIAQAYPYPPWDVGPLVGVSIDVLAAICEANGPMRCRVTAVSSEACFDTEGNGGPRVGSGLASGRFDGCLTWFDTAARKQLGVEFGHGYSRGSTPQLIASDGNPAYDALGAEGSLDGAEVAIFAGFFSDAPCLATHYSDFGAVFSASDDVSRSALVDDLLSGAIDLIFWDSVNTIPPGTHAVGVPIPECAPGELGLAVYPPSTARKNKSDALRRDYNCGLALIRESGELEAICAQSPHPGGDPGCILDGPPPTVQCLQDNPPKL